MSKNDALATVCVATPAFAKASARQASGVFYQNCGKGHSSSLPESNALVTNDKCEFSPIILERKGAKDRKCRLPLLKRMIPSCSRERPSDPFNERNASANSGVSRYSNFQDCIHFLLAAIRVVGHYKVRMVVLGCHFEKQMNHSDKFSGQWSVEKNGSPPS